MSTWQQRKWINAKVIVTDGDHEPLEEQINHESVFVTGLYWVKTEMIMPNLLMELGFFDSTSQARKAGWKDDKLEIPPGRSVFKIGSKTVVDIDAEGKPVWFKNTVTIFKPTPKEINATIE